MIMAGKSKYEGDKIPYEVAWDKTRVSVMTSLSHRTTFQTIQ